MIKKILLIEDDPVGIKLMETRLMRAGFAVLLASDGEVALQKVKSDRPDLILMDVEMPQMNGYEFIVELKMNLENTALPIIVLTAYDNMEPVFASKGINSYLTKPVDFDVLFQKINECFPSENN